MRRLMRAANGARGRGRHGLPATPRPRAAGTGRPVFTVADGSAATTGRGTLLSDADAGRIALATVTELVGTGDPALVCDLLREAATRPAAVLALAVLAVRLSMSEAASTPLVAVQRLAIEHELSLLQVS